MKLAMKRSMLIAAVIAVWSSNVLGENQPKARALSDAELDNVTAGSAFVVVGIHNPGKVPEHASRVNRTEHVSHCVNCVAIEPLPTTGGFLSVWKPGTSPATQIEPSFIQPIGTARF